jgi:SAM-dependent methyltransferase
VGAPDPAAGAPREQADASIRLSADGDADPRLAKVARHWASAQPNSGRTRWWLHPDVLRHVNACVCGSPVEGPWAGLERRMRELTAAGRFEKGVSVACGSAVKELHLLQEGLVGRFDLFEISRERVALGQASAAALGLSDRVRFHVRDAFAMELPGDYDLVYWNNALHHMFDVAKALQWSRERLQPGGWFVMDDFVGASRFQWPDVQLEIASRVRRVLPDRLLRDPGGTGGLLPRRLTRPSLQAMIERDPSEAADSDNILPAVKRLFPGASIVLTGGVVYNLALQDILANFEDDADGELLRSLLTLDADLAAKGLTHYACAFAPKQDG